MTIGFQPNGHPLVLLSWPWLLYPIALYQGVDRARIFELGKNKAASLKIKCTPPPPPRSVHCTDTPNRKITDAMAKSHLWVHRAPYSLVSHGCFVLTKKYPGNPKKCSSDLKASSASELHRQFAGQLLHRRPYNSPSCKDIS